MTDFVSMDSTLSSLEKSFGFAGAVIQILQALRTGEITGTCDHFHGRNASGAPRFELPDNAENFALPTQFWGYAQWQRDGETVICTNQLPFDPWAYNVDWRNGNFCVSGSRGRGRVRIFSNAIGVRLENAEAEAFLAKRGIEPDWVDLKPPENGAQSSQGRLLPVGRRGRKKGAGSLAKKDEPHLIKMAEMLKNGEALSVHHAARLVAPKAEGGGTEASKVTRLAKRYRALE